MRQRRGQRHRDKPEQLPTSEHVLPQLYYASEQMTGAEREAAWEELVQIADDWAVSVPIVHEDVLTAVWDDVKGFHVVPTANFWLQDVWLDR